MSSETHNEALEDVVYICEAKLSKDKKTLISYEGTSKNYEIPDGITVIGENAFLGNKQIESITIPASVTTIGDFCFKDCESLHNISIPFGVKKIGICAFANSAITKIIIPSSIQVLEDSAFCFCKRLKMVVFNGKNIEIGKACFSGCETLKNITLPLVKTIEKSTFENCESLKQIYIPGSVKCISSHAFYGCTKLKDVVLSEGVKEIHCMAFQSCDSLEEIRLPYSMEYVGESSFSDLKRCYYYNPATAFEENAFQWCGKEFRLFLPKGANFDNASKSMPKGIIGRNTTPDEGPINYDHLYFNMVPYTADLSIEDILNDSIPIGSWFSLHYCDNNGGVYSNGLMSFLMLEHDYFRSKNNKQKYYKILDGVKYICNGAFLLYYESSSIFSHNNCPLEQIDLPSSITTIGNYAFSGCSQLKTITIPNKVTHIGKNPFAGTGHLNIIKSKSPYFVVDSDCLICKETGTLIHCFKHKTGNEDFIIPEYVTQIGDYAFASLNTYSYYGAPNVKKLVIHKNIKHIGKGAFQNNSIIEEVVFESVDITIEEEAFSFCTSLKRVTLPRTLKVLSNNLFDYCKSLSEITIPDKLFKIGDSVFHDCISLSSIKIPSSLQTIGTNPFANSGIKRITNHSTFFKVEDGILYSNDKRNIISCFNKRKKVIIPKSVVEIGADAFHNCELLEEILIPSSVKAINKGAFSSCKALKNVRIEDEGISIIKTNTFSGCSSLQEFKIPNGVTEIEEFAFWGCNSLKTLYSPSTIKRVAYNAFNSHTVEITWLPYGLEKNELPGKKMSMSLEESGMWMDDFGVVYSLDNKTLIKATRPLNQYSVLEGTTTIKERAFVFTPWQRSLKEIHLPNSIEKIENNAFAYCDFSDIVLPESLKYMGLEIFYDCIRLKHVIIPSNVCIMDGNPFLGFNNWPHISYTPYKVINKSRYYKIQNKILYSYDYSRVISCLDSKSIKLIIDKASSICPYSFSSCEAKEIIIDSPIHVIEEYAFYSAHIKRAILPDSLIEIRHHAFANSDLTEITIPNSTQIIGDCAFWGHLQRVTINSRNIIIGKDAFHSDYLTQISVPRGCLEYFRKLIPENAGKIIEQ